MAFAHSLPSPTFYKTIKDAEPLSPIYANRATANRLRHYEQVKLPPGLIALGDAVCALCPVYGQGMTVSAVSALVLQNWLQHPLSPLDFQKKLARSNALAWAIATTQDSQFPTTAGRSKPSVLGEWMHKYTERLLQMTNDCCK